MSENKISRGYTSPDRVLSEGDIKRKKKKLTKTMKQMVNIAATGGSFKKFDRKSFKVKKTLDQIKTGKSGIRPNRGEITNPPSKDEVLKWTNTSNSKSALNMLGIKSKSPLNQDYDKNYKGDANKLLEEVRGEAANSAPEYNPPPTQEQREADPNYKFFITNKNDESNEVARKLDSLKYHVKFDKNKQPNLKMQRDLVKKHGLNRNTSKKKIDNPINLNDPYAGQYEGGAGYVDGADMGAGAKYFSNRADYQKLFDTITAAGQKLNDPEKKAERQAKYQEKRAKRIGDRTVRRVKKGKKGYEVTKQAHDRVTNITTQPGIGNIPNIKVERGGVDTSHGEKTVKNVQKIKKLKQKALENKIKAATLKKARKSKK
tara:strand:+ start:37 stop:1155 length:1119 start_codon:yes stop_codon:yes gene_type:complete